MDFLNFVSSLSESKKGFEFKSDDGYTRHIRVNNANNISFKLKRSDQYYYTNACCFTIPQNAEELNEMKYSMKHYKVCKGTSGKPGQVGHEDPVAWSSLDFPSCPRCAVHNLFETKLDDDFALQQCELCDKHMVSCQLGESRKVCIHDNHYCCGECYNNLLKHGVFFDEELNQEVIACPFCRKSCVV